MRFFPTPRADDTFSIADSIGARRDLSDQAFLAFMGEDFDYFDDWELHLVASRLRQAPWLAEVERWRTASPSNRSEPYPDVITNEVMERLRREAYQKANIVYRASDTSRNETEGFPARLSAIIRRTQLTVVFSFRWRYAIAVMGALFMAIGAMLWFSNDRSSMTALLAETELGARASLGHFPQYRSGGDPTMTLRPNLVVISSSRPLLQWTHEDSDQPATIDLFADGAPQSLFHAEGVRTGFARITTTLARGQFYVWSIRLRRDDREVTAVGVFYLLTDNALRVRETIGLRHALGLLELGKVREARSVRDLTRAERQTLERAILEATP